jgi:hypothetical protein
VSRQRHCRNLVTTLAGAYSALLQAAGKRRWAAPLSLDAVAMPPRPGTQYVWQRGSLLRRGRVLEALPPVALTIDETLHDPPCQVQLLLRCRLEPCESGALLRLDARYRLNPPARLNARHWRTEIRAHCERLLRAVELGVAGNADQLESDCRGHSKGSSSITATNTAAVNGRPSRR